MTKTPKTIASRSVYKNQYLDIKVDTLELNNHQWEQAYFTKPNKNGVGIVLLDKEGIYLLNQFRYPSQAFFWQIPLGMIDPNKTELETVKIELKEEAGAEAQKFTKIGSVVAEPGMSPQETFIYVAEDLTFKENNPSETEIGMKVKHFSFEKMRSMIKSGEIKCGFTLSALMLLHNNYLPPLPL